MNAMTTSNKHAVDSDLVSEFRLAILRLGRRLRQQSIGGLSPSQRSALSTLNRQGSMPLGQLADIEGVSGPSISGIVRRLAEKGLVELSDHPEDGRSVCVAATAEGVKALELGREERDAFLASRLQEFDDSEIEALATAIPLLYRIVEED